MGLDSGSTLLMDATGTIHMGTGSASNSRNGGNGDGDSANVGQTSPNSTSDGFILISTLNSGKSSWYANVTSKPSRTKVNFRTLFTPAGNGIDVVVPVESIRPISERFANTAYGFFLGKRVTYPVNANYVRNTWGKYGQVGSMFSSSTGFSLYNLAIWMVKPSAPLRPHSVHPPAATTPLSTSSPPRYLHHLNAPPCHHNIHATTTVTTAITSAPPLHGTAVIPIHHSTTPLTPPSPRHCHHTTNCRCHPHLHHHVTIAPPPPPSTTKGASGCAYHHRVRWVFKLASRVTVTSSPPADNIILRNVGVDLASMVRSDDTTQAKTTVVNEKPYSITNIKTYIPLVLDLNELNYDLWSELFTSKVLEYLILSREQILVQLIMLKNKTNLTPRAMQLVNDLQNVELGNLSITYYFSKINRLADLLANNDAPVDDKNLVYYAINGLGKKYVHTNPTNVGARSGNGNNSNRGSASRIMHGACITFSPTRPTQMSYAPRPGTTTFPQAFNAMMVQDYSDSSWYMDTGATSRLASDADGSLSRYKARLVANESSQQQGIYYDETFSLVVKPTTIHIVLSLAVSRQWPIHQLDMKNAFLYSHLSETVYMHQPPGFVDPAQPHHRAGMTNCNPCKTPADTKSKLGPDGDPVCLCMHDPREPHLFAMKRILHDLRGTLDHGLQLYVSPTSQLIAYSDADWAGCLTTRRSTSGYCVFLGDNLITWSFKRQHVTSRSSAEAEYRGVANDVAETAWVRNLLCELLMPLCTSTLVYCDNVSAVYLSCNPVQHQRTKHIEIDIHFVRDFVATGHVRVLHVPSRYQFANIFTKGLPSSLLQTPIVSTLRLGPIHGNPSPLLVYKHKTNYSVRKIIDDHLLLEVSSKFSWRKMVPIKVNFLAWKVKLDVLPTRFNLSKKGLDINSILCPICENHAKSSSHLFFACSMTRDIFRNIASWWDIKSPHVSSFEEWEMWTSSLTLSSRRKQILEANHIARNCQGELVDYEENKGVSVVFRGGREKESDG
uniref:Ribonuclease H-like domain-containing protein n=1 Tax=Tanacetum cinerariifolium TaxID=118510 RepID=A0A6L2N5L8_TANCI|nr:ribonuclease H-like domain-containing protein [Tanacetum cinerariifolium]